MDKTSAYWIGYYSARYAHVTGEPVGYLKRDGVNPETFDDYIVESDAPEFLDEDDAKAYTRGWAAYTLLVARRLL